MGRLTGPDVCFRKVDGVGDDVGRSPEAETTLIFLANSNRPEIT